jgi:hypothetical protein
LPTLAVPWPSNATGANVSFEYFLLENANGFDSLPVHFFYRFDENYGFDLPSLDHWTSIYAKDFLIVGDPHFRLHCAEHCRHFYRLGCLLLTKYGPHGRENFPRYLG